MPELPEVQSVVNSIEPHVVGKTIRSFIYSAGGKKPNVEPHQLKGNQIIQVVRVGKYILFPSREHGILISHLRMTGQWFFDEEYVERKYFRWGMSLEKDGELAGFLSFTDVRKFGTLDYVSLMYKYKPFKSLGVDGLSLCNEEAVSAVEEKFAKTNKPIKNVLLDQTAIAGVGNIYASEILWEVGIHPQTPTKKIVGRTKDVCDAAYKIFTEALEYGGCSISDYVGGTYHEKLKVYGKEDEPCPRCQTKISKIIQAGRSTFYCSSCQLL